MYTCDKYKRSTKILLSYSRPINEITNRIKLFHKLFCLDRYFNASNAVPKWSKFGIFNWKRAQIIFLWNAPVWFLIAILPMYVFFFIERSSRGATNRSMVQRLEHKTHNPEVTGSRRGGLCLHFSLRKRLTLIALWFRNHVKPLVNCANAPHRGTAYSVYRVVVS